MKKLTLLAALAGVCSAAQAQVVIYDTIGTKNLATGFVDTSTSGTNRQLEADTMNVSTAGLGVGQFWRVRKLDFVVGIDGGTTGFDKDVAAFIGFWRGVDLAAPAPGSMFSNFAPITGFHPDNPNPRTNDLGLGWSYGRVTREAGLSRTVFSLTFTQAQNVLLPTPSSLMGISVFMGTRAAGSSDGFATNDRLVGVSQTDTVLVGASTPQFIRDVDGNLRYASNEFRTNGAIGLNLGLRVEAEAVPEPGTMIALAAGVAAPIARRRR